ncbi:MAG: hypothetical protein IJS61_07590 [Firmicutes bacterium]|nr:hypothetical protein [Bacillota bacterium]
MIDFTSLTADWLKVLVAKLLKVNEDPLVCKWAEVTFCPLKFMSSG